MVLDDFDFDLPEELIAQHPSETRGASRLMALDRSRNDIAVTDFAAISGLFRAGDLLVINDTKVIPARLSGAKESGGRVEVFLVRKLALPGEIWHCLVKSSRAPRCGTVIGLPEGLTARVEGRDEGNVWRIAFTPPEDFDRRLEKAGTIPLPPYIKRPAGEHDRERYQTVFARVKGAVAAPTAGLHMTPDILAELRSSGVDIVPLTLHVGLGTFMPVRVDDLQEHRMHCEWYDIPAATATAVNAAKREGRRVVALGTTSARALEHAAGEDGLLRAESGDADIFIRPGYQFRMVDALITNFHLPKSTLLMLVAAFAGHDFLMKAYAEAVRRGFRFYSYGDAMFIY